MEDHGDVGDGDVGDGDGDVDDDTTIATMTTTPAIAILQRSSYRFVF